MSELASEECVQRLLKRKSNAKFDVFTEAITELLLDV